MMLRYLPLLKARGVGKLAVYCDAPLARLVRNIGQVDEVISATDPLPVGRFDLQCPIMSLPLAFGTRLESIPRQVPYLQVPVQKRLADVPRPHIGLLWAGGPLYPRNHLRSIRLERFAPLMKIPVLHFVSLQKGDEAAQLAATKWPIIDRMDECLDLFDTAALVEELDLVIGIDSAVAHLTGALGKPMWLLNRFESDWRWLLEREDSPWYPTIRILRQPRPGDWDSVIARSAVDLRAWLAHFHRRVGGR
jgi:ADP-heptose:LPS heptosyltransferase